MYQRKRKVVFEIKTGEGVTFIIIILVIFKEKLFEKVEGPTGKHLKHIFGEG